MELGIRVELMSSEYKTEIIAVILTKRNYNIFLLVAFFISSHDHSITTIIRMSTPLIYKITWMSNAIPDKPRNDKLANPAWQAATWRFRHPSEYYIFSY
jgi:hypothetical protein